MPLNLSDSEALDRTYAAARMMAGLDQAELANAAGLSAGTISNVERDVTEARYASIDQACPIPRASIGWVQPKQRPGLSLNFDCRRRGGAR